ncbi:hypothetical protein AHAS_Ahas11G0138000 [Arachis hypogaea]
MRAKQRWRLITKEQHFLVKVYKSKYFKFLSFMKDKVDSNLSWSWKSLLEGRKVLENGIE